jgi:photosystem II stability/assembly factor-like uncharacterized protein
MAKGGGRRTTGGVSAPWLRVSPNSYLFPYKIQVFGSGWAPCALQFYLDGNQPLMPTIVLVGNTAGQKLMPVAGEFVAHFTIPTLGTGVHRITAVATLRRRKLERTAEFTIERVVETEKDGRPTHRWLRRRVDFLRDRFPNGINPRPDSRLRAVEHRDAVRRLGFAVKGRIGATPRLDPDTARPPVDPGANWYCIGPTVVRNGQVFNTQPDLQVSSATSPISGRITSIAYDPLDTNIVYVGSAQGGVWKSLDGGLNWRPKSDYAPSLAIGCVTVDPSATVGGKSGRIFAGTGEPNSSVSYYGAGMLFSADAGETWVTRGTAVFARAAFSTIAVDPANNQHLYAATDTGLFQSIDEGVNWNLLDGGIFHDLVVDWTNPGGAELYAGKAGVGVRRSINGGATWSTLGGGLPPAHGRVALAKAPSDPNVLYAAFATSVTSGDTLDAIYRTGNGGTTWTPTAARPAVLTRVQASYNFVHPANPDIVLFGEVHLWRTTDGGASWTRVSTGSPGIHPDQHAITFHPTNGALVFVGNDGGVFYSVDAGVTYTHRNKDLATLQYYTCANHPLWDAVMLGGTQDNGAQRYLSHPAWEHSAPFDGAYVAINATTNNRQWFESRVYTHPMFRSDSAGARSSWVEKKGTISINSNYFYPPFAMDPNDSRVLYVGYEKLWRTADSAENWTNITDSLVNNGTNITAIAVAPSDSNTIFVGMENGHVFRVHFSAGTWTPTDVTSVPLPAGQISDIAIHPSYPSIVYLTTSNIIFSLPGEFINDHVFRTTDGGTTWSNLSAGLSQANPVNAIALDPVNPDTVFIGCDVGIFRSDNGGASWAAWDNGLPNCSVQDLKFFAPRRLLRAATFGRSIWERPVDAATLPRTDIYMRDDVLDTGLVTPGPSGVEHPFNPGEFVHWYQSPDIKVDSPDPVTGAYQTPSSDIDYLQFEELLHDNPRRDTSVRVHVQVNNRGDRPANNVKVRGFWANAGGGLPDLPVDFWTAFPNTDPSDTSVWHPVGPTRTIDVIYPGQPRIASWSWLVPATAPTHTCLFAVARSDEDNVTTSALEIATAVNADNNVTLKNLHVDDFIAGAGGGDGVGPYYIDFAVHAALGTFDIHINPGSLPRGTHIRVFFPKFKTRLPVKKAAVGLLIAAVKGLKIPERPEEAFGKPTKYKSNKSYMLKVGEGNKHVMPGVLGVIPDGKTFSAAIYVKLPKNVKPGSRFMFYVEQRSNGRLLGGSAYELRVRGQKPVRFRKKGSRPPERGTRRAIGKPKRPRI